MRPVNQLQACIVRHLNPPKFKGHAPANWGGRQRGANRTIERSFSTEPIMSSIALPLATGRCDHDAAPFGPIVIAPGVGRGPTALAAFDSALLDAGVANYNLICLSSVIPPGSRVERRRWSTPPQDWGRRLYCVVSQAREERPGHSVYAGIGWVQDPESGQGLFVELHDDDTERLDRDLRATLGSMQRQRGQAPRTVQTEIASAHCQDGPVCALVIAVYAAAAW
jgi:arginine decarboxylase